MSKPTGGATRAAGMRRLQDFAQRAGPLYAKSRNFDFGPERRGNVSMLSPWLRHRLVLEQEVVDAVLQPRVVGELGLVRVLHADHHDADDKRYEDSTDLAH